MSSSENSPSEMYVDPDNDLHQRLSTNDVDSLPSLHLQPASDDSDDDHSQPLVPKSSIPSLTSRPPALLRFPSQIYLHHSSSEHLDSDDESLSGSITLTGQADDPVVPQDLHFTSDSSVETIADPDTCTITPSPFIHDSDSSSASSTSSKSFEDIGIFQQSSFDESDDSWHTIQAPATQVPAPNDSQSASSNATFNSNFTASTTSQPARLIIPTAPVLPPHTILLPPSDATPDLTTPAIVSQDPNLVKAWNRLFAQASRPPTNRPDQSQIGPKFRQAYIDLINSTPNNNKVFGDSMLEKLANLCRFYFVNINGISSAQDFLAFQEILSSLQENGVDIFGLSETNLDWLRHMVRDMCGKICNDFFGTSLLATSTSSMRSNSTYKPGGTCTGLTQEHCGRYQNSGSDPHGLGRWSFVRLLGKAGESLVVVTAYRVCKNHVGRAGSTTAFHQEWQLLRLSGNLAPNPRKAFISDLIVEIKKWSKEGAHVILGGDFNENLGETIDGLARLVSECKLTDVHAHFHGIKNEPATYVRGTKRVDYIFVSETVLPFVRFCGIESFFSTVHSDHRGSFLDLDLVGLLGGESAKLVPTALRGVSGSSPHSEKYVLALYKYLLQHNVMNRGEKVFTAIEHASIPISTSLIIAINRIDKDITRAMLYAEKLCRQPDRAPWSKVLHQASKAVRFWKTWISGSRTNTDVSEALSSICAILEWDIIPVVDLSGAKLQLTSAQKDLKACRAKAAENRQKFLTALVAAAALNDDISKEKALKRQLHVEAMKSCYRKLRSALRPPGIRGGITKVEVKVGNSLVCYTEKADVHRECLCRNRRHFAQAKGTPWTVYPLCCVGTSATRFRVDTMPDGSKVRLPADTFLETRTLVELIQAAEPPTNPNISAEISRQDFISAITVWNENTSTSPSGRHLGHYKLLVNVLKDPAAKPDTKTKASEIIDLFVSLLNLASTKGFALDRWKKVVNVMIYKKPGVYLINKLRVIHLFEADYNFVIGLVFGRRALYSGVKNKTLHSSQWALPGRQCADVVVLRELTIGMAKMLKISLGGFENDAAACYDRLVMNMMGAAFERMGVPEGPLRLQEAVLLNVVHYLKTAFGITLDSYTSDALFRIYGVGQGSKAGPVSWAAVSSLLFQAQELLGQGVRFSCPQRLIHHLRHSDGYVDDTTLFLCDQLAWLSKPPTQRELFKLLHKEAQIWERLLWSSGGLLEIDKCRYYTMQWKFGESGKAKLITKAEMHQPAFMLTTGNTGTRVRVRQLDCDDAFRTLGIHKTISGDQTEQIAKLTEKSNNFAKGILASATTPFEAHTGYFTIWYPSCNYPLAATSLTRENCRKIQSFATAATLTKVKFNRHFPHAVVFGSPYYGGMGWRHMYYEQGIQHVLIIIKHLRTPGAFQSLLQITLRWYQCLAGVSFAPLEYPDIPLPHLEHAFLNCSRLFLDQCRAKLVIPSIPIKPLFRTQDTFIMEAVGTLKYTQGQAEQVNCCRLFLQADLLSEISSLSGTAIDICAWKGTERLPSHHDWPCQGRPGKLAWRLWRRTLIKLFCHEPVGNTLASTPGVLVSPLGSWLPESRAFQCARWSTFLNPENNQLFVPNHRPDDPPTYQVIQPLDRRTTHFISFDLGASQPLPVHQVPSPPASSIPVLLIPQGPLVKVEKSRTPGLQPPSPSPPVPTTFDEYCDQLPPWAYHLICFRRQLDTDTSQSLHQCLADGVPLFLCSDGGALKHVGSIGWVIATDTELLWDCCGTAYGWHANSFRSEGLSHLSMLVFLQAFINFYQIQPPISAYHDDTALPRRRPLLRAATDNKGLIQRIAQALERQTYQFPSDALRAEYDVIISITNIVTSLTFPLHWEHVKGHQDDTVPTALLTRMAQLNVHADELATISFEISTPMRMGPPLLDGIVDLRVNSITISSHYATHLRKAAGSEDFFLWYRTNYGWDTSTISLVDWDAHLAAIRKLSFSEKRFITKFNFQWLPTGHQQHKVDSAQSTVCPSCRSHEVEETETHLYQCPSRLPLVGKFFNDLQAFHETEHTAPVLQATLFEGLKNEIFDIPPSFSTYHAHEDLTRLRQEQTILGWGQLFRGRLSQKWAHIQHQFLLTLKVDRHFYTGDIWARKLINLLWTFTRSLWDARNADRHGHTPLQSESIRKTRMEATVQALYDSRNRMLVADHDIFLLPMKKRFEDHDAARIALWIREAKAVVSTSIRDAKQATKRTFRSIASFFPRLHPRTLEQPTGAPSRRRVTRRAPGSRTSARRASRLFEPAPVVLTPRPNSDDSSSSSPPALQTRSFVTNPISNATARRRAHTPRPTSRSPTRPAVTPTPRPPRRRPNTSIPSRTFARNRTSRATARRNASPTFVPTPRPPRHSLVMDVEEATIRVPEAPSFVPTPRPPRHGDLVMDVEEVPARTPVPPAPPSVPIPVPSPTPSLTVSPLRRRSLVMDLEEAPRTVPNYPLVPPD